jgi:hypothetical protein
MVARVISYVPAGLFQDVSKCHFSGSFLFVGNRFKAVSLTDETEKKSSNVQMPWIMVTPSRDSRFTGENIPTPIPRRASLPVWGNPPDSPTQGPTTHVIATCTWRPDINLSFLSPIWQFHVYLLT